MINQTSKRVHFCATLSAVTLLLSASAVSSAPISEGGGGNRPHVTFTPPPSQPVEQPPATLPVPPTPPTVNTVMPIDVTHTTQYMNMIGPRPGENDALIGLTPSNFFPEPKNLKGPTDFILVLNESDDDKFNRESPYMVTLDKGTVLASVRRPSQTGFIHTKLADIAFSANSDAFISVEDGIVRIRNVDGMGQALKVKINEGPGSGQAITIAPGYELVVADHKLTRIDLKPSDGILRRGTHVLAGGQAAVSEYHVESALQHSALIQHIDLGKEGDKAKRVIADMSRMAAVLNHLNGPSQAYGEH